MSRLWFALGIIGISLALAAPTRAAETDQFMTWNIELRDSAEVLNTYLNQAAKDYVERRNRSNAKTETVEEMGTGFYLYLFQGLHSSRIRKFIWDTPEIDRYPSADTSAWAYQRDSIYRGLSFPYFMPMARTIRVGEIYLGIDKVCHFFGFGRRYFQRYVRLTGEGLSHEEAIEKIIENGLSQESSLVGGLVDGVISHGDLEANFQGFQMLLALTRGEEPFFVRGECGNWRTQGQIDYRDWVTPGFDESYRLPYFTFFRWRKVRPLLEERYCASPEAQQRLAARFERYQKYPPSAFQQYLESQFAETGRSCYEDIDIGDLCARQ